MQKKELLNIKLGASELLHPIAPLECYSSNNIQLDKKRETEKNT